MLAKMKFALTTVLGLLLLVAATVGSAGAHAPIVIGSGLDLTRTTIPVAIGGRRYACVLDTGTSTMLLSRGAAASAGLRGDTPVEEISPDGRRYTDLRTQIDNLVVGGYALHPMAALISSKLPGEIVLCGYDFFAQVPTLIDRDRQSVTLFPASTDLAAMHCVPIDITPRVPLVSVRIDGTMVSDVVLDSGLVGGGALWDQIADRLAAPPAAGANGPPAGAPFAGAPFAGAPAGPFVQNGLRCGLQAQLAYFDGQPPAPIALCASAGRPDGYNGIVETNLPAVHRFAIDYPQRRMCFSLGDARLGPTARFR
jgi:hypothetical protein